MSRKLDDLDSAFRKKIEETLIACAEKHSIIMRPFFTLRDPWEQAKLYRKSRTTAEIESMAARMEAAGASYCAQALRSVGPQSGTLGDHATNAPPGNSWHQWGRAVDCYWDVNGRAVWDINKDYGEGNGYRVYALEADRNKLFPAGPNWGWDWPHIQDSDLSSPLKLYTWKEIDKHMKHLYY